jgi:hypothetical protein
MLEKLKSEVGPLPAAPERPSALRRPDVPAARPPVREGIYRPYIQQDISDRQKERTSVSAWAENREAILFGMLSALAATVVGALQGIHYLVLAGTVVFCVFALVAAAALLRVCLVSRSRPSSEAEHVLADRLDALSRRVEMLSSKAAAEGLPSRASAQAGEPELERKLEELRVVVRSLSKAIEGGK